MNEYHKIQSVFKRDPATNYKTFLMNQYSLPEFEYLRNNLWEWTEKVDGTNIRIGVKVECDVPELLIGGRTDNAQIPAPLITALNATFLSKLDKMVEMFEGTDFTLYGEGFGGSIQKGSERYGAHQRFILFDVQVGDWWLKGEDVTDVAKQLDLLLVPVIGVGTLKDMVQRIYEDTLTDSRVGKGKMEGYVARPVVELKTRSGHRIITKIKRKDFEVK